MKTKQLLYLVAATVVLLVIYVLMQRTSVPVAQVKYLANIDTSKVTQVSIYHKGETVTLDRHDNGWTLTNPVNYPANGRLVKAMLAKLTDMRVESEITKNKDRWHDFEVDDTSGTKVTVMQGQDRTEFIIGKPATGYRHSYARLVGKDAVKLILGVYGSTFDRKADNWRDRSILMGVQSSDITGIDAGDLSMTRSDKTWTMKLKNGKEETADWNKATRVQAAVARLSTSTFPTEDEYKGVNFKKPEKTLKVTLDGGKTDVVAFYKDPKRDNRFFARLEGNPTVFAVYEGVLKPIFKDPKDLLPDKNSGNTSAAPQASAMKGNPVIEQAKPLKKK